MITIMMLYDRDLAAQVFDTWSSTHVRDPSGLAIMSLGYNMLVPGMFVYGEFFAKGISVDNDLSAISLLKWIRWIRSSARVVIADLGGRHR